MTFDKTNSEYIREYERINTSTDPQEVMTQYSITSAELAILTEDLQRTKLRYEKEFINLCNSPEYIRDYKTIKQREQCATNVLTSLKLEVIAKELEYNMCKGRLKVLDWQLKFLLKGED